MTKNKDKTICLDCENNAIQQYAALIIDYDKLSRYCKTLEKGYDIAQELNQALRDEVESLKVLLRCYKKDGE